MNWHFRIATLLSMYSNKGLTDQWYQPESGKIDKNEHWEVTQILQIKDYELSILCGFSA